MLPVDFAIFSPPIRRWAQWSQVPTNGLPGRRLALGDLVLVVREDEVDAAGVDVERLAEVAHAHRGALDVPARAPGPDRGLPRRLVRLGALPEREVADVVLAVLVGLDPLARPGAARGRGGRGARRRATRRSGRRPSRRRSGRRGPSPRGASRSAPTMSSMWCGRPRQDVGRRQPERRGVGEEPRRSSGPRAPRSRPRPPLAPRMILSSMSVMFITHVTRSPR